MRKIAKMPAASRRALFTNTAEKTELTSAIIEKDFWVCWSLDYLFHRSKWKDHLSFKGGTSLSKAFHLIERFSEDLDIMLDWRVLGYDMEEPWQQRTKTQQDKFNKEANERTVAFLQDYFVPEVQADMLSELGAEIIVEPDIDDKQTILIKYPQEFSDATIKQEIRLEIGALAVWTPSAVKEITPYAADHYSDIFDEPSTSILTVLPERTFWEKVTILHQEANRPDNSIMPPRYSRHYYDMLCLAASWVKEAAFSDLELLGKVVAFKIKFYPRSWAKYEEAKPGSVRLVPPAHCLKVFEEDYNHMRGMIFGAVPGFGDLLKGVQKLENEINSL